MPLYSTIIQAMLGRAMSRHYFYNSREMWRNGRRWEMSKATWKNSLYTSFLQTTNSRVQFIPILNFDLSYSHFKFLLYSDKHMHQCNLRGDTAIKISTYALIHKAFWNSFWAGYLDRPFEIRYRNIWKWYILYWG